MVKLSPAQIRQRREAARSRDHGAGYAAGHTPSALRRRRTARIVGTAALVAVGVPAYRQAGRIHAQQLHGSVKVDPLSGRLTEAYQGPHSDSVEGVADRVTVMRGAAKAKRKAMQRARKG